MRSACLLQAAKQGPLSVLYAVLEVSRSGLSADVQRHARVRAQAAEVAGLARVKALAAQTRCSSGSRRLVQQPARLVSADSKPLSL